MLPEAITKLRLFQSCRKLVIVIYRLTKLLPEEEKYGLIAQMRRAVVSVLLNLVEGYSRHTRDDKKHFYVIARSSFRELECQLLIVKDLGYITEAQFKYTSQIMEQVGGLLINFIYSQS